MTLKEKVIQLEEVIEEAISGFEEDNDWQVDEIYLDKIDVTTYGGRPKHILNNVNISIIKTN